VSLHTPLDQLDLDEFARVLQLNVISLVAMTQAVLPAMRAQRSGRIVNISSGTTRMALPGVGACAATKATVNMLTAVARRELERPTHDRRQRLGRGPAALAGDAQHPVASLVGEVLHVAAQGLVDAQAVVDEQGDERGRASGVGVGRGEQPV
jgi:short chain dehydrogenase